VFWVDMVRALDRKEITHAEIIERLQISRATLYRMLTRGRQWAEEEDGERGSPELDEAPLLHLTDDPSSERAGWYELGTDRSSHDHLGGAVLIANHNGTRLRRQRLGTGTRSSEVRNDKYKPDPSLKGGVG
jgi:hypothetical protein